MDVQNEGVSRETIARGPSQAEPGRSLLAENSTVLKVRTAKPLLGEFSG